MDTWWLLMPIYEFLCQKCHAKSSFLVKGVTTPFTAQCSACGSNELVRTVSSFAYHKSLMTIHEEAGLEIAPQTQEMLQADREGEMPEPLKDL